jgi:hypothetical protein
MVSILQVYNALRDLANKEQKGFITPQVFNSFAPLAQINIYNEIFSELVDAKRLNRQNFDPGRDKSVRKQKEEDLSYFLRTENGFCPGGIVSKPLDLSKIVSLRADTNVTTAQLVSSNIDPALCELVYDAEKIERIIGSNLSTPTREYPVALVSDVTIDIFPSFVNRYSLIYYAKPTSFEINTSEISLDPPYYSFRESSFNGETLETFSSYGSRNFMLPPHYLNEVVMEMAKLIGIRLRDDRVSVFSNQEEASE